MTSADSSKGEFVPPREVPASSPLAEGEGAVRVADLWGLHTRDPWRAMRVYRAARVLVREETTEYDFRMGHWMVYVADSCPSERAWLLAAAERHVARCAERLEAVTLPHAAGAMRALVAEYARLSAVEVEHPSAGESRLNPS